METFLFYVFSIIAVVSSLMVITKKNPVSGALFLILTFFSIAGIFVLLNSYFIAIIQVLVYAGAIMVVFLFAVMLLNLRGLENEEGRSGFMGALGIFAAAITGIFFLGALMTIKKLEIEPEFASVTGNVKQIGTIMFSKYFLPFEITSFLLLVAMIGVVVISRRRVEEV